MAYCLGDKQYRNEPLHALAVELINYLLKLEGLPPIQEGESIISHVQSNRIDILVEIGSESILIIEDKINATESDGQLDRYINAMKTIYPNRTVSAVYLKTSDQSNFDEVRKTGYTVCTREDIISLFQPWAKTLDSEIFQDFFSFITTLQNNVDSYGIEPVDEWILKQDAWKGFYKLLQMRLDNKFEWKYVSNPRGGFLGAWWLFDEWRDPVSGELFEVYLQIEQGPLCFKIAVYESDDKRAVRDRWFHTLMQEAARRQIAINRPAKMGHGTWMTVARVERSEWLCKLPNGLIDVEGTIAYLKMATELVHAASNYVVLESLQAY